MEGQRLPQDDSENIEDCPDIILEENTAGGSEQVSKITITHICKS